MLTRPRSESSSSLAASSLRSALLDCLGDRLFVGDAQIVVKLLTCRTVRRDAMVYEAVPDEDKTPRNHCAQHPEHGSRAAVEVCQSSIAKKAIPLSAVPAKADAV